MPQNQKIKIVFLGSSEFSQPILEGLIKNQASQVILVITEPDKPAGRGQKITASPIKLLAQKYKIPVFQPVKLDKNFTLQLKNQAPDLIVVASYGQILPADILSLPKYGCLNIHPSLLPKYRGPTPLQATILAGEKKAGISIIKMDEKIDHGPILSQKSLKISNSETTSSLSEKLSKLGAQLLLHMLPLYLKGKIKPKPQNEEQASYTPLIKKEDGKINWWQKAEDIERKIRAYQPWPGTFTFWLDPKGKKRLIKIKEAKILHPQIGCARNPQPGFVFQTQDGNLAVNCGQGSLKIKKIQLEGKKTMEAKEFLNGYPQITGSQLQ